MGYRGEDAEGDCPSGGEIKPRLKTSLSRLTEFKSTLWRSRFVPELTPLLHSCATMPSVAQRGKDNREIKGGSTRTLQVTDTPSPNYSGLKEGLSQGHWCPCHWHHSAILLLLHSAASWLSLVLGQGWERKQEKNETPHLHTFLFSGASLLILWREREGLLEFFCELLLCSSETGDFLWSRSKARKEKSRRKTKFLSLSSLRL